jgi:hypothetical protein
MSFPLEYHNTVRRSIPASLALSGLLLLPLILISSSLAQGNSPTSSSSGHASSVTIPSILSPSHNNSVPTNSLVKSPKPPHSSNGTGQNNGHPQQHSGNVVYYPYLYAVPFPYLTDVIDNGASGDNDPDYQGGPTVFDRRGQGAYSYIPPGSESPVEPNAVEAQTEDAPGSAYDPAPTPPLEPTVLIFKDGHQLEIDNYAIVNQTLYDLTPGHPRKIALADLDLPGTEKQNDDHGVTFQLPPSSQAN